MKKIKKIGIIGCGSIGTEIALALKKKLIPAKLIAVCDKDPKKSKQLIKSLKLPVKNLTLNKLISSVDLVVETASVDALPEIVEQVIKYGKELFVLSAGGLLKDRFLLNRILRNNTKVYIPNGAIAGVDAVQAGSIAGIDEVSLITRKPPEGLAGAPYIKKNKINIESLKEEKVIFTGSVFEAIEGFPANINVSAVLAIASNRIGRTKVRIIADPNIKRNIHEVSVKGKFGTIFTRVENVPSPSNRKTSYLAILSAISLLRMICAGSTLVANSTNLKK
ncbi:MAG: aspartate dehydrogenase [bacterium]